MYFWNLNDAVFKDADKNRTKKLLRPITSTGTYFNRNRSKEGGSKG